MAYTARRIIVTTAALAAKANTAAARVDTLGGSSTFTVPLRVTGDAGNTVVAYWCSWLFDPSELTRLRGFAQAGGFTAAELADRPAGFSADPGALPRLSIFDAALWEPAQVLTALGLDALTPTF